MPYPEHYFKSGCYGHHSIPILLDGQHVRGDYTEALQFPPILPSSSHWETIHVFEIVPIGLYFRNSVVVSLCVLVLQYLIIVPAAYSFARHEYFGKNIFLNCTVRINDPAADHLPSGLPDVQPDEDVKNIYTVNITIYFQSIWYFHAPPVFYADPSGSRELPNWTIRR